MLPAGVEIKIPSHINFFIIVFLPLTIFNDAVCLLCLRRDTSLMAMAVFFIPLFVVTIISRGEMFIILDLFISLYIFLTLNLFIKNPKVPLFIP